MSEFKNTMGVVLVENWGSDKKVAQSARVSTLGLDNDREKVEGLVKALWRDGHFSPFEHSGMTLALDVPLFVRDQIVRHKSMSFSVKSLRYSDADPVFYIPSDDRPIVQVGKALDYRREQGDGLQKSVVARAHLQAGQDAWYQYVQMMEAGVADEVARSVLPTSLYTQMWVSGSLRSWGHFIEQRIDPHAQHEVREVAEKAGEIISEMYPITYEAFRGSREDD